ncbi:MAG: hypothetical protein HQ507_10345 [Candidatus Marinimicrobia bacterium]|nr:hypothetical protein [Candidatus Neomarinimicrobiota bacterium]
MKKTLNITCLILILISPLFSALLTDNLEVVVPTGLPSTYTLSSTSEFSGPSCPKITLLVIETPNGSVVLRQVARQSYVPINLPVNDGEAIGKIIVINTPLATMGEGGKLKINVILE